MRQGNDSMNTHARPFFSVISNQFDSTTDRCSVNTTECWNRKILNYWQRHPVVKRSAPQPQAQYVHRLPVHVPGVHITPPAGFVMLLQVPPQTVSQLAFASSCSKPSENKLTSSPIAIKPLLGQSVLIVRAIDISPIEVFIHKSPRLTPGAAQRTLLPTQIELHRTSQFTCD